MPASSHEVPVIRVKLEDHPNADKLALVRIDDIRVVGVRKEEWKDGDLGAFIQADMVVPEGQTFAWLGDSRRIRPRKFRGVMSWGLLVPPPEGAKEGEDVAERMGIVRYSPPEEIHMGSNAERGPSHYPPVHDLESYYKYHHLLQPGEQVVVTEKIHGTSGRFCFFDERMYAGSYRVWKQYEPGSCIFWKLLEKYPQIEIYCRTHPGHTVYGEVFGYQGKKKIQDLTYDIPEGETIFRVFDIRDEQGVYVPYPDVVCCSGMPVVPFMWGGAYDHDQIMGLVSGPSTLASTQIREGIVVKPLKERYDPEIGRIALKAVSMDYLERRK